MTTIRCNSDECACNEAGVCQLDDVEMEVTNKLEPRCKSIRLSYNPTDQDTY